MKSPTPRILLFDEETSMALGYFFGRTYETNIVSIKEQSFLLSFAFKWLGEKKVYTFALPDFDRYKHNKHDDSDLVRKLSEIVGQADIVIGHNSSRFDVPTMNTRLMFHGYDPVPPFKQIDTCKEARRMFKMPSNKLDDIGEYLGVGRKLPNTGKHLWLACMEGDLKAWKAMVKYNAQDVVLLERVYLRLRPFIKHHNINEATRSLGACPKCGSKHLQSRGMAYFRTSEAQRFQCQDCRAWSLGPKTQLAARITIV